MGQLLHHLKEVFMHEDNCAVYVHVNLINGKKYFGITVQEPEKRWKNGKGYYRNDHFTNAINKYGWDNFGHFVLYKNIPIKIAKNIEELLIKEHMSYDPRFGYNKTYGGELEKHTEETRRKMSEAMKGEKNPIKRPEVFKKMFENMPKKPVEAIDPETGEVVFRFDSTQSAERAGFDHGAVSKCCNGIWRTYKGYIWRFIKEAIEDDPNSGQ